MARLRRRAATSATHGSGGGDVGARRGSSGRVRRAARCGGRRDAAARSSCGITFLFFLIDY